jgi:16S rRNA (uracil1498-N3)-methyltransferase
LPREGRQGRRRGARRDGARGLARDRGERIAEQAARQCGRGDTTIVQGPCDWADALALAASCDVRFVLDPHASEPLGGHLPLAVANDASIALAIGPEGGLAESELALAADLGWISASMGPFVLRTETVAAAVLGAIRVLTP